MCVCVGGGGCSTPSLFSSKFHYLPSKDDLVCGILVPPLSINEHSELKYRFLSPNLFKEPRMNRFYQPMQPGRPVYDNPGCRIGPPGAVFFNFYGVQESIPGSQFRQPMQPGGQIQQPYSFSVRDQGSGFFPALLLTVHISFKKFSF